MLEQAPVAKSLSSRNAIHQRRAWMCAGNFYVSSRRNSVRAPAKDAGQRRQLWDTLVDQTGAEWQFES